MDVYIKNINTRVFNRNPSILIPFSFSAFVTALSVRMTNLCRVINKVRELNERYKLDD